MPPGAGWGRLYPKLCYGLTVPLTCLAIAVCLVSAAAGPRARDAAQAKHARAQLEAYLDAHDVADAGQLRAVTAAPEDPLMAIALDPAVKGLVRARAVAALRVVPSPAVRTFLGKLLRDKATATDATERLLLRRAAIALGWLGGPGASQDLAGLFENQDAEVRVDAALGLGLTRAAEAPALLHRQLAVEELPRVRQQIERQLRELGQPPAPPEEPQRPRERTPMRGGL